MFDDPFPLAQSCYQTLSGSIASVFAGDQKVFAPFANDVVLLEPLLQSGLHVSENAKSQCDGAGHVGNLYGNSFFVCVSVVIFLRFCLLLRAVCVVLSAFRLWFLPSAFAVCL